MDKNLVSFGCSWTFGMGLIDLQSPDHYLPGPVCSKYAWPQIMADTLNRSCINTVIPSASNLQILLEFLNYEFAPNDYAAIMWTFPERDLLLHDDGESTQIASFMEKSFFKDILKNFIGYTAGKFSVSKEMENLPALYFKIHSLSDMSRRSQLYEYLAGLHLKNKNIPFVMGRIVSYDDPLCNTLLGVSDFCKNKVNFKDVVIDRAANGTHPGIESQKLFAKMLIEFGWT